MKHWLKNRFLMFELQPAQSSWGLWQHTGGQFDLERVRMQLDYQCESRSYKILERWRSRDLQNFNQTESPHGTLEILELQLQPDLTGLSCRLTFAMPQEFPLFLWKVSLHNQGHQPIFPGRITMLDTTFLRAKLANKNSQPAFFSNGWGSWNYSGVYGAHESFRRTNLGPITSPARVNAGTPHPKTPGQFGSDMFGLLGDRASRKGLLVGFLSQLQHFGSLEAHLDTPEIGLRLWANGDGARLDPGESISTDWACILFLDINNRDPMAPYLEAVARQHDLKPDSHSFIRPSPTGWCSWYQYYQKISAEIIRRNLARAAQLQDELPLEVIQIDDGFEPHVGDWLEAVAEFPNGVKPLAAEIDQAGFTPGLWLAPFIVQRHSRLARQHPNWLLRGKFNRPVNAGFIWNTFTTALDLTHPEALDYAAEVVHAAVHDWGYPYLKLDFLYAAALPGCYYNPTRTRAQTLRHSLERLREAAGDQSFLLGCGCPLGPALGLVDAMRVGADVDGYWHPVQFGIHSLFKVEPDLPSARNAIQNALTRAPLHRRWWLNDPDCLLLRPDTQLTLAEVQTLATVTALTDGALFLSDDLSSLPTERLRIAKALLPLIGGQVQVLDWFDESTPRRLRVDINSPAGDRHLLAIFNWQDTVAEVHLDLADYKLPVNGYYLAREFWSGEVFTISTGKLPIHLQAHGAALLSVQRRSPQSPQYLGSDLHISQGQEVIDWDWQAAGGELRLALRRPGHARGQIDLVLPHPLQSVYQDNRPAYWQNRAPDIYRLFVDFNEQVELLVKCS